SELTSEAELIPVNEVSSLIAAPGRTISVVNESGETPEGLQLVKRGKKLEVLVDDELITSIDNFYSTEGDGGYLTDSGDIIAYSSESDIEEGAVVWAAGSGSFMTTGLASALGIAGGAWLLGSSSEEKDQDAKVSVAPVAGPFNSDAVVNIYNATGSLIGNGNINSETGQVEVNLGRYRGVIVVEVVDNNGDEPDYISEATGEPTDLDTVLRAVTEVTGRGTLTLSLTPVTELAAQLAGLPDDLSELANDPLTRDDLVVNDV
ncbi:MAG: hypothetical protein ACPGYX_00785, partial [Oceanobacter sp.]